MAKSKEELAELKTRLDSIKEEIRSLSTDELRQVSGGDEDYECQEYICPRCGSPNTSCRIEEGHKKWTCHDCHNQWETSIV